MIVRTMTSEGVGDGLGLVEPGLEHIEIFPDLAELKYVPAIGAEAGCGVVAQGQIGLAIDRDVIVVVDHHELAEAEVASDAVVTMPSEEAHLRRWRDLVIEQVRAYRVRNCDSAITIPTTLATPWPTDRS